MRNKINLKFNNKSYAFSLIEAMIILVLVSVGIMALIPLITQKTDVPRWIAIKDAATGSITSLLYGRENANMTRVGFNYISPTPTPSTALPAAKMEVSDSIKTTNGIPYTSVMLGGTMVNVTGNYSFPPIDPEVWFGYPLFRTHHYGDDSIVIGQGNIASAVSNAIVIGYNTDITTVSATSPPSVTNVAPTSTYSDGAMQIGTNSVTPVHYASDYIGYNLYYDKANKIIYFRQGGTDTTLMAVDEANKSVDLGTKGIVLQGEVRLTGSSYSCTLKDPAAVGDYPFLSITDGTSQFQQCTGIDLCTSPSSCTSSDKRLKNIYADYQKGIVEINNVDTYKYSYKNSSTPKTYVGVVAQKMIGIFDEALNKGEDGYYAVDKTPIMYAMVNAVKSINNSQKEVKKEQKEINKELDFLIEKAGKK